MFSNRPDAFIKDVVSSQFTGYTTLLLLCGVLKKEWQKRRGYIK